MPAKLFYFQRTAVKYSVLTGSGALIALDNTACSTNLIFHRGTAREKHASSNGWGDAVPRAVWQKVPGFVPAGWAPRAAQPCGPGGDSGDGSDGDRASHPVCSPLGCGGPGHSCWEAEASRAVLGAFRNHFECRADLILGRCLKCPERGICGEALGQRSESSCVV